MSDEIQIRPMSAEDLTQVAAIEKATFSDAWSQEGFAESLAREDTVCLCAASGQRVLGYALLYTVLDEGELMNIAVDETCRGQGIGRKLLNAVLAQGASRGISHFYLEVRAGNLPAQKLYQSAGFAVDGIRPDFYEKPRENAFLMSLHR